MPLYSTDTLDSRLTLTYPARDLWRWYISNSKYAVSFCSIANNVEIRHGILIATVALSHKISSCRLSCISPNTFIAQNRKTAITFNLAKRIYENDPDRLACLTKGEHYAPCRTSIFDLIEQLNDRGSSSATRKDDAVNLHQERPKRNKQAEIPW